MADVLSLALANVLSPPVLFFGLGLAGAFSRSDLTIPEAVAKGMSLYLLMAIGFKGGAEVSAHPMDLQLALTVLASIGLSLAIPAIAFILLRRFAGLDAIDAAAVSGHYGSISVVTFVAATQALTDLGIVFEGYMVAIAAIMEAPALLSALYLAARGAKGQSIGQSNGSALIREILFSGSILLLVGSFIIGAVTGKEGLDRVAPLIVSPFYGVLCLFLLDMGLVAGRSFAGGREHLTFKTMAFALYMPLVSATIAAFVAALLGLSVGGTALLITLAASSSYIAAPAAMRVALPKANPSIYLTLSIAITFPFNLTLGIPIYIALAGFVNRLWS